jgi:hypothetical protein
MVTDDEFVNDILSGTPDSWDSDDGAESIAVAYVRELERRVIALGGSLERWTEDEEPVIKGCRCGHLQEGPW